MKLYCFRLNGFSFGLVSNGEVNPTNYYTGSQNEGPVFTTAACLGPYLESLGMSFKGNGINDLSKHYGQHIITRLLSGLSKTGSSNSVGYTLLDFPKIMSISGRSAGKYIVDKLIELGVTNMGSVKKSGEQKGCYSLDVFSLQAVNALVKSLGKTLNTSDLAISDIRLKELPPFKQHGNGVFLELNSRVGVNPVSNSKSFKLFSSNVISSDTSRPEDFVNEEALDFSNMQEVKTDLVRQDLQNLEVLLDRSVKLITEIRSLLDE